MVNGRAAFHWTFALVAVLFWVTGYGITEYRLVTPLTLGVLGKATSNLLHELLGVPFLLLLLAHVYLATRG